jgi:hypothetical protein
MTFIRSLRKELEREGSNPLSKEPPATDSSGTIIPPCPCNTAKILLASSGLNQLRSSEAAPPYTSRIFNAQSSKPTQKQTLNTHNDPSDFHDDTVSISSSCPMSGNDWCYDTSKDLVPVQPIRRICNSDGGFLSSANRLLDVQPGVYPENDLGFQPNINGTKGKGCRFSYPIGPNNLADELQSARSELTNFRQQKHQAAIDFLAHELYEMKSKDREQLSGSRGEQSGDAFRRAADFPTVTKQSLSELDMSEIITNIKLRNDVSFDRDRNFQTKINGTKGKEQKATSNTYWKALISKSESYVRPFQGTASLVHLAQPSHESSIWTSWVDWIEEVVGSIDPTISDRKKANLFPFTKCRYTRWLSTLSSRVFTSRYTAGLVFSMLMGPAGAVDPFDGVIGPALHIPASQTPSPYAQTLAVGGCLGITLILRSRLFGAVKALVAPIMAATSVLFVMLRNDSAIRAETAWA